MFYYIIVLHLSMYEDTSSNSEKHVYKLALKDLKKYLAVFYLIYIYCYIAKTFCLLF